jgi:hypothetical protein
MPPGHPPTSTHTRAHTHTICASLTFSTFLKCLLSRRDHAVNIVKVTPSGVPSSNDVNVSLPEPTTSTSTHSSSSATAMGADTESSTLTFSQKMLYFSQACDSFVYKRFKILGQMLHDYRWRFLLIPMLLMVPMM